MQVAYEYGSFMHLGKVKKDKNFRTFCAYLWNMAFQVLDKAYVRVWLVAKCVKYEISGFCER